MKEFTIYFQIFGKKMKIKIRAANKETAINILKGKIKIDKITTKQPDVINDIMKFFNK